MAKDQVDGVIVSVRYKPEGQVAWVRAYLRRGKIFSDVVLLEREKLIQDIKSGKNYHAGQRLPYFGGRFEVKSPLKVIRNNNSEILVTGDSQTARDDLEGVPVI